MQWESYIQIVDCEFCIDFGAVVSLPIGNTHFPIGNRHRLGSNWEQGTWEHPVAWEHFGNWEHLFRPWEHREHSSVGNTLRQSLHQEAPSRAPHHCQPQPTEPARRFGSYPKIDVRGRRTRYHALTRLCERAQHRHRCQPCVSACASAFGGSRPVTLDCNSHQSFALRDNSRQVRASSWLIT